MKCVLFFIAFCVALAVSQESISQDDIYPGCACGNCVCRLYTSCLDEAIVPYSHCPASYVVGCCNLTKLHELENEKRMFDSKIQVQIP